MGSKENLDCAFAGESMANGKYTAYARKADEEGYPEIANLFRSTAEGETAHALGHLKFMNAVGTTKENLQAAINGETHEFTKMYPDFAKTARAEGNEDLAKWFESLAKSEKSHAERYQKALDSLK